jgi:hypothetical protein
VEHAGSWNPDAESGLWACRADEHPGRPLCLRAIVDEPVTRATFEHVLGAFAAAGVFGRRRFRCETGGSWRSVR